MVSPASWNQMLLGMMDGLVGENVDLEPARIAFEATRGDFAARFAAAVQVMIARLAKPEVVIDIPEHPEQLSKNALEALVRPAVVGFLGSHPTKGELLIPELSPARFHCDEVARMCPTSLRSVALRMA
ncbi:hypothetical protein [Saccharothrix luteola]|uniref:hypothetical protein n=1 Tax=Saccharothrix luteola TaxID=2893018 RepID=UPI001E63BAD3|nr:hypothetical protein [Saccharothrix luteola]MCC8251207.1 hypothetical protein [Saccharothrix luteola]